MAQTVKDNLMLLLVECVRNTTMLWGSEDWEVVDAWIEDNELICDVMRDEAIEQRVFDVTNMVGISVDADDQNVGRITITGLDNDGAKLFDIIVKDGLT